MSSKLGKPSVQTETWDDDHRQVGVETRSDIWEERFGIWMIYFPNGELLWHLQILQSLRVGKLLFFLE